MGIIDALEILKEALMGINEALYNRERPLWK